MEFNEKLVELRKRKGLTQEELAEVLFVSRTAISKWEAGRGLPNIDSLKAISKFFGVTLDELLSGEELLFIAENDQRKNVHSLQNLLFGLLDCTMALLLFLPFFGLRENGVIHTVSLMELGPFPMYLKILYFTFVFGTLGFGIMLLALQNLRQCFWICYTHWMSLTLSCFGVCLFIISRQPYAAILTFLFLVCKAGLLLKRR